MSALIDFPQDVPWEKHHAFLLIDGVTVPDLKSKLSAWHPAAPRIALYAGTRFDAISEVSPWLVVLEGPEDLVFQAFVANASREWGALIFSDKPLLAVVGHLRGLLTVQVPDGPEVMLRLADPAVAHALFNMPNRDERLFGPIDTLVLADCVEGRWHRHQRCASDASVLPKKYVLSAEQNNALDGADLRRATLKLDAHLLEYFPDLRTSGSLPQRWPALHQQVSDAYALGFSSQSDLTYYVNIIAWLGDSPIAQHPEIARLLDRACVGASSTRVAAAAELARTWANNQPAMQELS
ncbi:MULTISPECIES: DUF4123 domain-containing protein [unclassified Pseudomonas]|uniref:DUF4123 domain-containing protein n=1 Tax=unclassified Pseudomonas TaxID=196821 RepID=UPI002AC9ABC4|nr:MULTISPECIES: DUF4123 domain-containing protein [unclassified Pseudomonas]MEB0043585.1 DUF4123 domain-containing protein [Pseudomonas sp. MH10]MEB0119455.1 DUF4123 domain-containing protein [Pseudomonas sp. CCI1.2]WPX65775.1 DUF4123 domain-containing protein [Pseudomonas sp. MH10]